MGYSDYSSHGGHHFQRPDTSETSYRDHDHRSSKRKSEETSHCRHHGDSSYGNDDIGENSYSYGQKKQKPRESESGSSNFWDRLMNFLKGQDEAGKNDTDWESDSGYGSDYDPVLPKKSYSRSGASTEQKTVDNKTPVADGTVAAASTEKPPAGSATAAATATPVKAFDPATQVNAADFGVDASKADNQNELQAAIKAANAQGKELYLGAGTFNHSGVLDIGGGKLTGAGPATVLHATNPDQAALKISGDGGSISNLKTTVNASNRSSQPDASAILVQNASNASVTGVTAQGASANGIRLDRANGATISNNLVTGTNADGIALMNGSTNNMVKSNVVDQAADDALSSDSYVGDAIQNSNNTFEGNLIQNSRYGRAAVSMGGKDDKMINNVVNNAPDHSPIVGGTDGNSGTMTGSGAVISGNQVNNGTSPSLEEILGWAPGTIDAASTYSNYVPGTGPGANNTPGNRT